MSEKKLVLVGIAIMEKEKNFPRIFISSAGKEGVTWSNAKIQLFTKAQAFEGAKLDKRKAVKVFVEVEDE